MDIFGAMLMLRALSQAPELVLEVRSKRLPSYLSFIYHRWHSLLPSCLSFLTGGFVSTNGKEKNWKWVSSVISKMGFVFLEQGFHRMLVPMCISISVSCSGTGFYYQTRGLKHGRAIVVATCAAVASIVTGVLAGMLALGKRLPEAPTARVSLLLGWFLIIIGVFLLMSSSRLVRRLPRPLRHLIPSGVERNFSARRSGSARVRDSNPSAVIQAATLHHLVSSPPKEKA